MLYTIEEYLPEKTCDYILKLCRMIGHCLEESTREGKIVKNS